MSAHSVNNGCINLEYQRKRAKTLLKQLKGGLAPEQQTLLRNLNPSAPLTLSSAQWLIAKELGFRSWPALKAHVDAIAFAARHPQFVADDEVNTTHWRCGNDIEHKLRLAGFRGAFHTLTDPLCMGPVQALPAEHYRHMRCDYIAQTYHLNTEEVAQRFDTEYAQLHTLPNAAHIVLWCEADPYDQLFLVRLLSTLTQLPPKLEIIEIDRQPGIARFVGMGQLSPDVLAWLWPQRKPIRPEALLLAQRTWRAWCSPSPESIAMLAQHDHSALPLLAPALRRLLQELPGNRDGLSLTERLALRYIAEKGAISLARTFAELNARREPLPFLGDMMFYATMKPLLEGEQPLLVTHEAHRDFAQCVVGVTPLGERVLQQEAYWLDYAPQARWVGGVCLSPRQAHWTLDENAQPRWRKP